MFTKQHYETIAEILAFNRDTHTRVPEDVSITECIAGDLADYFARDNARFDRERFLKACGY